MEKDIIYNANSLPQIKTAERKKTMLENKGYNLVNIASNPITGKVIMTYRKIVTACIIAAIFAASCSGSRYCKQGNPNYRPYNTKQFKFR